MANPIECIDCGNVPNGHYIDCKSCNQPICNECKSDDDECKLCCDCMDTFCDWWDENGCEECMEKEDKEELCLVCYKQFFIR